MDGAKALPMIAHAARAAGTMEKLLAHPRVADVLLRRVLGSIVVDREPTWARSVRTSLLKMGASSLPPEGLPAMAKFLTATRVFHESTLRAHQRGEPIVWASWPVPAAVVAAFGVVVITPEMFYSVANAADGWGSTRMCEAAERHGVPAEVCSINKCVIGAWLSGELPAPTVFVSASQPCDGNQAGNKILRELLDADHFAMSGPYERSPQSIALWSKAVWELIPKLEEKLRRPLDWDLLRRHAQNLNRVNRALNLVTALHRSAPSPGLLNLLTIYWRMVVASGWDPDIADGAELLMAAAQQRVEKATRQKLPRERLRVVQGDPCAAWTDFAAWLKRDYGGTIVCDYLGHFDHPTIDLGTRESLIEGLVRDRLLVSMNRQSHGAMEYTLDELATALREYDADCVLFHSSVGCKHNLALRHEVEEVCREAQVPACFLDADIIDRRVADEPVLREKIRTFLAAEGLPR